MTKDNQIHISASDFENELLARMQGGNRQERRASKRINRKDLGIKSGVLVTSSTPISEILDNEDDLPMLQRELVVQETLEAQMNLRRLTFNVYRSSGVSEPTARKVIFSFNDNSPRLTQQIAIEGGRKLFQARAVVKNIHARISGLPAIYQDNEERDLTVLMRDGEFPANEIFDEALRARAESIALLRMQVAWLEVKPTAAQAEIPVPTPQTVEEKPKQVISPVESAVPSVSQPVPTYKLDEWEVYFSQRPWSLSPSHLVKIETASAEEAENSVESATRRFRSIKPASIINALNHHLFSKDTIQRALSTRFRYAPESERDWVKAKRGKDRLGFSIDEESKKVVFCIEGRDIVYRGS